MTARQWMYTSAAMFVLAGLSIHTTLGLFCAAAAAAFIAIILADS